MESNRSGASSCFVVGCLGAAGVVILGLVIAGGAGYFAYQKMLEFTESEPLELPAVTLTQEDYDVLKARVDEFGTALDEGTAVEPFEISDEEVNAMLVYNEDLSWLGDNLRLQFEQDTVYATLSWPLDEFGLQGRYLNGRGTFDVFVRGGEIFVVPISFEVAGEPIPESVMEGFRGQNMLDDVGSNPQGGTDLAATIEDLENKLEGLEVESGKLILVPKGALAEIETLPSIAPVDEEAPEAAATP